MQLPIFLRNLFMSESKQEKPEIKKTIESETDKTEEDFEKTSFGTKINNVKRHLMNSGDISSWEAIVLYRATRLSAIIYVLRQRGYNIETVTERKMTVQGKVSSYARYYYIDYIPNSNK